MAKNIADYIVDLLDKDNLDLKQTFKRRCTDWKYVLHRDLRENILDDAPLVKSWFYIDICKYLSIMSVKDTSPSKLYMPLTEYQNAIMDVHYFDKHPEIIPFLDKQTAVRICSPELQEIVNFCRSLDLYVFVPWNFNCRFDKNFYVSWEHWKDAIKK